MAASILVAGLDSRSLPLEAPLLKREGHTLQQFASARDLFEALASQESRLVVLGSRLSDLDLPGAIRRIRASPFTRHVSVLALLPATEPEESRPLALDAGANAVLRRPLDEAELEGWLAKLLTVPRRVEARVPIQGQLVGTPKADERGHFYGLTRNISLNGLLLASPLRLDPGRDVELEFSLPEVRPGLRALARVVREAPEVAWPHIGYGVEFLFLPQESIQNITSFVKGRIVASLQPDAPRGIHSTVRREFWVYEILEPVAGPDGWHAEIRRAPRSEWRAGEAGPYYVVLGHTPEDALAEARGFIQHHG